MNKEHAVIERPDEVTRIQNANGFVLRGRVSGALSVSRAFGNIELKDLIIAEPESCTIPIMHDDDLLILASDGIYRSYSREYVAQRAMELRN